MTTTPTTDHQERARVRSRIGSLILEFCCENRTFHMEDLRLYVQNWVDVAPDSVSRILRQLRQQRVLNYSVVSRRQSLYRTERVKRPAEQAELFYERAS
ncbi:hypothetical protein LCGC14_2771810 [marine sediment metagenome]|uniref:Uncharacterized protein n=1 Tax=marine sediment metagenome TaxID=412755 RepID=A0A0F8YVW2_9ZZZZ